MSTFTIIPSHVMAVRQVVDSKRHDPFFRRRHAKNVANPPQQLSMDEFWHWTVVCMCTSVQKSGPNSRVSNFVRERPFALSLSACREKRNLSTFAEQVLRIRGLRFGLRIAQQMHRNIQWLCNGGWTSVEEQFAKISKLPENTTPAARISAEREAARVIMGRNGALAGVGPKQARNVWQCIGITQYEIPLDSRICDWLNALSPSFGIVAKKLYASVPYYDAMMSNVQALCQSAGVLPCEFDAAVFANADDEEWPEQDNVF